MKTSRQNPTQAFPRAFTLIELLIVVAIISILASIAVPNFLDAQVRAKVSRVKHDMRALSQAVETYHLDHNRWPYRYDRGMSVFEAPYVTVYDGITNKIIHPKIQQMSCLTTPVAYVTSLPIDVFDIHQHYPDNLIDYWDEEETQLFININPLLVRPMRAYEPYRVHNPDDVGYLLSSVGPDGYLGGMHYMGLAPGFVSGTFISYHPDWRRRTPLEFSMYYGAYDPTNGTVSAGNIYLAPKMGGLDQTGINLFKKCFPEALRADWPLPIK